jgi:hypothetical protein
MKLFPLATRTLLPSLFASLGIAVSGSSCAHAATSSPMQYGTLPTVTSPSVVGVNDMRGWWLGSPNLAGNYPVQAHRNLASRDTTELAKSKLTIRTDFDLAQIDTNKDGVIDTWTLPDAFFKTLSQKKLRTLVLFRGNFPNTTAGRLAYANSVKAVVDRYKSGGTYWATNPSLVPSPLTDAELGNEVNQVTYFSGTPQDYGKLLGQVWKRVTVSTPNFKFVSAGLAETSSNGMTPSQWLNAALDVADDEIGNNQTARFFALKGIGFHAYGYPDWSAQQAVYNYDSFLQGVLAYAGNGTVLPPVWLTEFGWKYTPATNVNGNTYSEAEILSRYQYMVNNLTGNTTRPTAAMFAYNYRMGGSGNGLDDGFGWNSTQGTLDGGDTTQAQVDVQRSYGNYFSNFAMQKAQNY